MSDSPALSVRWAQRETFTQVYRRCAPQVYRYLLAKLGNVQDAEDVTAQTFMAALAQWNTYRGEGEVAAWLIGIARRKAARHLKQRRSLVSIETLVELPDGNLSPEDQAVRRLQLADVLRTIQYLSPDRAEVLRLHFFAGLDNTEVSRVMKKSQAAVRMLLSRALADLKKALEEV
ncbi:MAG TPA: sigma-70 family RNA polymerase sigma factor [Aggregatilineaceae bacterium]|nr:sigma-70 family RNA polymerase sigma factor [Aggregatilineaceae bacterium]